MLDNVSMSTRLNERTIDSLVVVGYHDEWICRVSELIIDVCDRQTPESAPDRFAGELASFLLGVTFDECLAHEVRKRSLERVAAGRAEHKLDSHVDIVYDDLRRFLANAASERYSNLAVRCGPTSILIGLPCRVCCTDS